ncbi:amidohydrolase [Anaerocolumna aminovalerica]|jgi:imidazolonepropionase-like amidohydrolase|uniref:amidohydrolase n=1 Tax=Anaerocolumna aminovalerica TaxID=1527 RepID=UPI00248B5F8A|nr:amidohydrolase [Anaerocolumna aminovalerica]
MLLIKNGTINDAVNEVPYLSDILISQGKIIKIQPNIIPDKETAVIDAAGKYIFPGFIDAHSHIGLDGYGIGYEGQDYNELNDILTPQLRAIDAIQPMDETFLKAVKAGITSVATGPGSSNVLGGTFTAIKTVGKRIDDMVIRPAIAMKCAFGENPKRCYRDKFDTTRMSTAAKLREMLFKANEYARKIEAAGEDESKRPLFDIKLEALLPVIRKEIPLKAHAHQANDMFTALRIAREFGVDITLEHVTEGHLIVEELAKENIPLAVGPSLGHPTKFELRNKTWVTPGVLANAGCQVSIITDAPVIPQEYLPLCAGLAVKSGMKPFDALRAITINPARHIGIADRVGSIEIGKDGDIVITDGNPFEIGTTVEAVFIEGSLVSGEIKSF